MEQDRLWFKDAIIYELHVRSFADATGDGIGDFRGLYERLGYFEELGVTALWLLPFYPSPLRDDGYDIADYYSVNPAYGTMDDFRAFLAEAHRRKLRVITEVVINHTSDQHAWFQRARRAPAGSPERDFYVWSDTPQRYEEARIIFKDFESSNWSWDPVAQAYFWHRFYSHQPDLNFENPQVRQAVFEVIDFWLGMGVDGLRLDAIPYLFEREGTSCENLPETHGFLKELRQHVDERFPSSMLLAEANQWPEDATAYFGQGDECHMAFHFPLMPRLFMALQMEDRFPIIDILEQTPEIPAVCQWAIFLRNHDELTLEMVTDEERDYMYRIYAEDPRARINLGIRRRLAPLLGNNRRKIELINSLLLSLPGTPIIYYGDEIGMGDNFYLGDRNGVRTPMQWSADRNAGFSRANPQQLFLPVIIDPEFNYEAVNVDMQQRNLSSLFWWMRRILAIRKGRRAFSYGRIEFLRSSNAKVLAFLRRDNAETILVISNLSRFSQAVRLDLSSFKGCVLKELFGGGVFAEITEQPLFFTLGPHGFYWLLLGQKPASTPSDQELALTLAMTPAWSDELTSVLENTVLPRYLPGCRWFGHKQRTIRNLRVLSSIAPASENASIRILLIEVAFVEGSSAIQSLPLAIADAREGDAEHGLVARLNDGMALWDALYLRSCRSRLFEMIARSEAWDGGGASLEGFADPAIAGSESEASRLIGGEQSNTTISFDDKCLLKFLRQIEAGRHPDAEILRALASRGFPHVPRYLGEIRLRFSGGTGVSALLTSYVENQGDGWIYTLDAITRYFERVLSAKMRGGERPDMTELAGGIFPERARQLGERTGALHRCLEESNDLPEFTPEPFTSHSQRSLYQAMRSLVRRTQVELEEKMLNLAPETQRLAAEWIETIPRIVDAYATLLGRKFIFTKIRIHGDYHLGQVLNTGNDFVIIDFGGEPHKSLGERLMKRSALVDVAGMLRSFDYAVAVSLRQQRREDRDELRVWADAWLELTTGAFLEGYVRSTEGGTFVPRTRGDFDLLTQLFVIDKAVSEIVYELNYRPDYLPIPLGAVHRVLAKVNPPGGAPEPVS